MMLGLINILASIIILFLGISVYFKGLNKKIKRVYLLFSLSCFFWLFFYGLSYIYTLHQDIPKILMRFGYIGVIFITFTIYHFVVVFLSLFSKEKKFVYLSYILGVIFSLLLFTPYFISFKKHSWGWYPKAEILHPLFMASTIFYIFRGLFLCICSVIKDKNKFTSYNYERIKYFIIGILVFSFSALDFLQNYFADFIPFGFLFIIIYSLITSYAIIKHNLLDIKIVLTRAGIFIFLYFFILGIPFWLGFKIKSWFLSTSFMAILASFGPFIYSYLRNQAEEILLKEQHRYQRALVEFSKKLVRVKELDNLVEEIVVNLIDNIKICFCGIYLFEEEYNYYKLKYYSPMNQKDRFKDFISLDERLIKVLHKNKKPTINEEVLYENIDRGVFIPFFGEDLLLGFLILGPKQNNTPYTDNDLIIFETLSYYISLAIENSLFFKKLEEQQRKARIQEMDIFSYSIAQKIQPKDMDKKSCIPNKSTI